MVIIRLISLCAEFDQPKYNFAKEMGLVLVFACFVQRPKMLEALLGGNIDPQLMSQLQPGIAKTRLQNSSRPIDIRTWSVGHNSGNDGLHP